MEDSKTVSIEQYNELLKEVKELSSYIQNTKENQQNEPVSYSDNNKALEDRVQATSFVNSFVNSSVRNYPELNQETIESIFDYNTKHYKDIIEQSNMIKASLYKEYFNAVDSSYIPTPDKEFIEQIKALKEPDIVKHLSKLETIERYTRDNKKNDARARMGFSNQRDTRQNGSIERLRDLIAKVNG